MERETENETFGASPGPGAGAALSREDELPGIDELRAQRLRSMLLAHERRLLALRLAFGFERLLRNQETAFRHSVGLRFLAIRQRHVTSVARLMLPRGGAAS